MPRLSDRRKNHAARYGEAVARHYMEKYADNPSDFPQGLDSLPYIVSDVASSMLGMSCTWTVTSEERRIAETTAIQAVILYIRVAERYAAGYTGQSLERFLTTKFSST